MVKYMAIVILLFVILSFDCLAKREIKIFTLSDTTKLEVILGDIDLLFISDIDLNLINNLNNCKVKAIQFNGCFGDLNHIFKQIDKSELSEIYIENCYFKAIINEEENDYKNIDLSGIEENSLYLSIENSTGHFEFTNVKSISRIMAYESNSLTLDFLKLNKSIISITLMNISSFFIKNLATISEFENLDWLRLEFNDFCNDKIDLKKLTKLTGLSLANFDYFPENINSNKLEFLGLDRIYDIKYSDLNKIIGNNIGLNSLYIKNCNLFNIPQNISKSKELEILSLSNNKISSLNFDFSDLMKLRTLFLDDNYIFEFNYELFKLSSINQINIEFNSLEKRITSPKYKKIIINQEGNPFTE